MSFPLFQSAKELEQKKKPYLVQNWFPKLNKKKYSRFFLKYKLTQKYSLYEKVL